MAVACSAVLSIQLLSFFGNFEIQGAFNLK